MLESTHMNSKWREGVVADLGKGIRFVLASTPSSANLGGSRKRWQHEKARKALGEILPDAKIDALALGI